MPASRFDMAQRESCVPKPPKRSCFEHSAFHSQPPYIQALTNPLALGRSYSESGSVSPTDSHTSKELHIYIKTMGFKPFRDTYLHSTFSQSLLNHILPETGMGVGYPLPTQLHPMRKFRNPGRSNAEPSVAELSFHGTSPHSSS